MEIGDYVQYTPDNSNSTYTLKATYSGYTSDQIIDNSYDPQSWRIIKLDYDNHITELLGVPNNNQKTIWLYGLSGYNNGVYLLNNICKSRYENASLGTTARSLNIEDIENGMNATGIAARNNYMAGTVQFGTTRMYTGDYAKYPEIYEYEKYSGINVSDVTDGTQIVDGSINKIAQEKMNPNGKTLSEDIYTSPVTYTAGIAAKNLTYTQTYYQFDNISKSYFKDVNFYEVIFQTGTNFWVASRYADCISRNPDANLGIRRIIGSGLYGYDMYGSDGDFNGYNYRLAPLVSLNFDIKIKSGIGNKENPYIIVK